MGSEIENVIWIVGILAIYIGRDAKLHRMNGLCWSLATFIPIIVLRLMGLDIWAIKVSLNYPIKIFGIYNLIILLFSLLTLPIYLKLRKRKIDE